MTDSRFDMGDLVECGAPEIITSFREVSLNWAENKNYPW